MEAWKTVLREGFLPDLPTAGLEALRDALARDDPRLLQGATTSPPPLMYVQDWPCEEACPLGWVGRQGGTNPECATVGDVEEWFARVTFGADQRLNEAAACRWFLNWWDDTPRTEAVRELLHEVRWEIDSRKAAGAGLPPAPADPQTVPQEVFS